MGLAGVRRTEDGFNAGRETGIEAGHGWMFGCYAAECKRFRWATPFINERPLLPIYPHRSSHLRVQVPFLQFRPAGTALAGMASTGPVWLRT
jgi:hypothetical protein